MYDNKFIGALVVVVFFKMVFQNPKLEQTLNFKIQNLIFKTQNKHQFMIYFINKYMI